MNMYVANLSYHTSEADLKDLFSKYGLVTSVKIIIDRVTNQSRGFGFVEMASVEEGNAALKDLNGKDIEGRSLSVSIARAKENRFDKNAY